MHQRRASRFDWKREKAIFPIAMETPIPWEQSYVTRYIVEAEPSGIRSQLATHFEFTQSFLNALPEVRAGFAYAEGKWTLRQVVGHILDSQAIFAYRAMCFSRGEAKPLPGFEEADYAQHWRRDDIPLAEVVRGYKLQSQVTLAQASTLTAAELERPGVANGIALTPLVVYRVLIGHERHHLRVLSERYGAAVTAAA